MQTNPNEHIYSYLEQFVGKPAGYALMLTGAWGSGKTFLIRSFYQQRSDCIYISVNGAAKAGEVVERLYHAAFPVLADSTMRALGSIARSFAGAFRISSDLEMKDLLNLDSYRILIIDDIERSTMEVEELFGLINNYVEHENKHVILLANEEQLIKNAKYSIIREKVVGFTLDVKPDFEGAILNYSKSFTDKYKRFIQDNIEIVLNITRTSKIKNIRSTKYVIDEFEVIYDQLVEASISDDMQAQIFATFFVLNYAYKVGLINRYDIENRSSSSSLRYIRQQREDYEPDNFEKLSDIFSGLDVYSKSMDNEYLVSKICDGFHDSNKLARTLGDITGRSNPSENPEWRNLWYLVHQDGDVIEESLHRMMTKFKARDYDDAGVILHVFGLLHRMADAGLLKWNRDRIQRECFKFVLDKFKDGTLPVLESEFPTNYRHGSAHGLGFTSIKEETFQKSWDFYAEKSDELKSKKVLSMIIDICSSHPFDTEKFKSVIIPGFSEESIYDEPILNKINPEWLAKKILGEPAHKQYDILYSIGARYKDYSHRNVVEAE